MTSLNPQERYGVRIIVIPSGAESLVKAIVDLRRRLLCCQDHPANLIPFVAHNQGWYGTSRDGALASHPHRTLPPQHNRMNDKKQGVDPMLAGYTLPGMHPFIFRDHQA